MLPESVVALPHERTVYLTLGTLFNGAADFAVPLEALRDLPVNVVVTCGYDVDPVAFEPLPHNVAIERWVSQALLLPRCSAVICRRSRHTDRCAGKRRTGGLLAARRGPIRQRGAGSAHWRRCRSVTRSGFGGVDPRRHAPGARRGLLRRRGRQLRSEIKLLPDPSAVVDELTRRA